MMTAWCIPCPDHIIIDHSLNEPNGPRPGFWMDFQCLSASYQFHLKLNPFFQAPLEPV